MTTKLLWKQHQRRGRSRNPALAITAVGASTRRVTDLNRRTSRDPVRVPFRRLR